MSRRSPNAGVALLEVIISLALVGLIVLFLMKMQVLGARHSSAASTVLDDAPLYSNRIDLRNAIAGALAKSPQDGAPVFIGTPEGFSFWTPLSRVQMASVSYHDRALLYQDLDIERPLLTAASAVRFQYFDNPTGWADTWGIDNSLPDLIKIIAETDSDQEWPVFVVSPRLWQ